VASIKQGFKVKNSTDQLNLRKPVLLVSPGGVEPPVVLSCNLNIEAVDNKMVCEATGRTGSFCTGCSANEADMHGERAEELFYLDLGADKVWLHFKELRAQLGLEADRLEDVVITSGRGVFRGVFRSVG
jgi:hypothetical protein